MAKFETRGQILGLFLGAAAVAVLLILLLTVEVYSTLIQYRKRITRS
jgi:hypothetical protein